MDLSKLQPIKTDDGHVVRPIIEFLAEYRRGLLHDELSRALHEVLGEVVACDKPGEVHLKLKVVPTGGDQVEIAAEVLAKHPKAAPLKAPYFVDRHGNPSRHDPAQSALFDQED